MDFYEEIKHSLYSQKTIIGRTHFEWKDFIEAKHNEAPYKGKAFYQTLAKTMAITGMKIADKEKGEVPTYQELVFLKVLEYCKQQIEKIEKPQTETKTEQETIEMKPVLKPEAVQVVFEIIKDFFSTEQQPDLKQVIETGNIASKKLLFKGNGNRLTDTFKKLIEHDFITGCQKQDLINWIISNFTFTQQNKVKAFIYDTVEKTISRNYYPCKSPLIEIKNLQIQKVQQPRKRKQSKY